MNLPPKLRTRIYSYISWIYLWAPCLLHSYASFTVVNTTQNFHFNIPFLFFLSDFDPLFQYANFLSYSVSLTPSSICCEILGIVENIKAHLVIYHFSFIYYHNVLYFMFNPCTFVFNATEHNHLLPLHTDVIYWPLGLPFYSLKHFIHWTLVFLFVTVPAISLNDVSQWSIQ